MVAEFEQYIKDGYKYELRALHPQSQLAAARLQGLQEGTEQGMQFEYTRFTERITELEAECAALKRTELGDLLQANAELLAERDELMRLADACKEGADRMQQVITAVENAMHSEILNLDVEAAFDAYNAAHNIRSK